MKVMHCWLAVLPALALLAALAAAAPSGTQDEGSLYTVDQVATLLARDPGHWAGQTVRVRGVALTCMGSGSPLGYLLCPTAPLDPGLVGASAALPLALDTHGAWLAALHRLPLAGQVLPPQQIVQWGAVATYRVRLRAIPLSLCGTGSCYEALLLDAAPYPLVGGLQ